MTAGLLLAIAVAAASAAPPPAIDARVDDAVARGRARVVVTLAVPGGIRPEGRLSPEQIATQRQAIADAQSAVLARLAGTDFVLVRRFESSPLVALEIGPSALAALRAMTDLVARVAPDAVLPPARR